jgi:hypothetical protein
MRLPHSRENVQPGLYFYPRDEKQFDLILVDSLELIMVRKGGEWVPYERRSEFWDEPSDSTILPEFMDRAIELVDLYQTDDIPVTWKEAKTYDVIY